MSYGYSVKLISTNKAANGRSLGVKLGRVCIAAGIPVSTVAKRLRVSRQTVYNWFAGVSKPSPDKVDQVQALIDKI